MRATVAAKAGNMYADLSKETCKAPPCLGSGIYSFGE